MIRVQRIHKQTPITPVGAVEGDGDAAVDEFVQIEMDSEQITQSNASFVHQHRRSDASFDGLKYESEFLKSRQSAILKTNVQLRTLKPSEADEGLDDIDLHQSRKPDKEYDDVQFYGNERKVSEAVFPNDKQKEDHTTRVSTTAAKSRASLNVSSGSLQMEDYFMQDQEKRKNEQMKRIITDITKFKCYFVKFRFNFFAEFFFYHTLYCVFLGPLANPIINYFGKGLSRNLMFWGQARSTYTQFIVFLLQSAAIFIYATQPTERVYFQAEIIYLFFVMLFRIQTIAAKYATFDPYKILAIKNNVFKKEDLVGDFFLNDWRDQNDRIIYEEIYCAQRVYEIDPSWLYLEFIVNPEPATASKLKECNEALSVFHKSEVSKFEPLSIHTNSLNNESFFVYGIIKKLIQKFQTLHSGSIKYSKIFSLAYGILRSIAPTVYKICQYGFEEYFTETKGYEFFVSAIIALVTFFQYFFTTWMLLQGIIDMRRKIYLMEQMAFMISPRRLRNIDSDKVLPTINIFKSSNLKAWQLMRNVCQEYGKRYDLRVGVYFLSLVIGILCEIVLLSLQLTYVIKLEESFIAILLVETVFMMIVFMMILFNGAQINEMFDLHDSILNQNKGVLMDIYRLRRRYFDEDFKTQNYLYSKCVQKIREEVKVLNLVNISDHIKEIVESYNTHIEELRFDKQQNPFRIGSLKVSNGLLESGIIGIVSIAVAMVGKYLSTRLETNQIK